MIFLALWILFSQRISLIGVVLSVASTALHRWWEEILDFKISFKRKFSHIHIKHCINHREALASKELSSVFNEVMQVVIKVVNFVKSRDLNCRLFKDLCSTENAEHSTLLLSTAVRWFSRGSTLKRVFILRNEVKDFLHNRKMKRQLLFRWSAHCLPCALDWRFWETESAELFHCKVEANGCFNCKIPIVLLLTSWLFSSSSKNWWFCFVSALQGIYCNNV